MNKTVIKPHKGLLDSNRALIVFSLVVAALCWLIVAMTQSTTTTVVIYDVPVRIDAQADSLADIGLYPIHTDTQYVDVEVNGLRSVVGLLEPADFSVVARLNGVTEAATYTLAVISAESTPSPDYDILSFSPSTVEVRFDRRERRSFRVEDRINGLAIASGYTEKDTTVSPRTVEIEGPVTELDKIGLCQITAELSSPLDRSFSADFPIEVLDLNGEPLNIEESHLTMSSGEASLLIQVLKLAEIPLTFDFTLTPLGFPLRELDTRVRLSQESVRIAGPADAIDRMTEINLGYLDIRDITPNSNAFAFNVPLPTPEDQFMRIDNVTSVAVTVDMAGLESARFNVTDLRVVGVPIGYYAEPLALTLPNVLFVGRPEILTTLTEESIVAEIDLFEREVVIGSYPCPVKITVPGKGLVWAAGDYTVTVQVTEVPLVLDEEEDAQ